MKRYEFTIYMSMKCDAEEGHEKEAVEAILAELSRRFPFLPNNASPTYVEASELDAA